MNLFQPWNLFFVVCFIVYGWIRHVYINKTKGEKKLISHFDGLERTLVAGMTPGFLIFPGLYLFTSLLSFSDYRLPPALMWIGGILMVGSLWLFWRSHADLGQNWSVSIEIREDHNLVTNGVYSLIRHPMYASIWMWGIGQGLVLQNWLAGWLFAAGFAVMYFVRLPREEKMMIEQFGDPYREYMKRTGRIFPKRIRPEQ
jgi:protein-S-isoprenylcysteine O-methyltransferase Ste14